MIGVLFRIKLHFIKIEEFANYCYTLCREILIICVISICIRFKRISWGIIMDNIKYKELPVEIAQYVDALMDAAPCGIGIFGLNDGDNPYYFNTQLSIITGYTEEEMKRAIKMKPGSLVYKEDWEIVEQAKEKILKSGKIRDLQYRSMKKGGGVCWISLNVTRIDVQKGHSFYYASFMDVTDKIHRMQMMQEKKEWENSRYRMIVEQSGADVFEWNLETGSFFQSEQYKQYEISKIDGKKLLQSHNAIEYVHEEDIPILFHFMKEAKKEKGFTSCQMRLKKIDGSYQWSKVCISFAKEKGKYSRVLGTIYNIEEEMRAKEEMQKASKEVETL